MLIRPTGLTLVYIFFWVLSIAARFGRLISIETKLLNSIAIMKEALFVVINRTIQLCDYTRAFSLSTLVFQCKSQLSLGCNLCQVCWSIACQCLVWCQGCDQNVRSSLSSLTKYLQEAANDLTRIQKEKNANIQRLQQLLNSKDHEVQVLCAEVLNAQPACTLVIASAENVLGRDTSWTLHSGLFDNFTVHIFIVPFSASVLHLFFLLCFRP